MIRFFSGSILSIKWLLGILRAYMRVRPVATTAVIVLSVLSRVANLLAFLLPLKVILLAGSDGIPKYFTPFISAEDKLSWILGLAGAAVVSYLLTLIFGEFSKRLVDSGSSKVLEGANKLALVGKQREQARSNYSKVTQIAADGVFAIVCLAVLAVVSPVLLGVLVGLVISELVFTGVVLNSNRIAFIRGVRVYIDQSISEYLKILSSLNFMVGFFVILAPFLSGRDSNILLAILAVLLVRRVLPALESVVVGIAGLYKQRHLVDPLVFRGRQSQKKESNENQLVREFFSKEARKALAEKVLASARPELEVVDVSWQDSPITGAYTFVIICEGLDSVRRVYLQQQVFPPSQAHLLGHEDLLFSMVKRRDLNGPEMLSRFREDSFECQICDYGSGYAVQASEYKEALTGLVGDLWSFTPPRKLMKAFNSGRAPLSGRLTKGFVKRLAVAVDCDAEFRIFQQLQARLSDIRVRLERLPLHVFNPNVSRANIVRLRSGAFGFMGWTRWTIEPIGAGTPSVLERGRLMGMLERVNSRRRDLEFEIGLSDVEFAQTCWNLELAISRGKYKEALGVAANLVSKLP